ncbi:MAG: hypothetical protein AAB674_00395 [Patescibacteria group bacterium]
MAEEKDYYIEYNRSKGKKVLVWAPVERWGLLVSLEEVIQAANEEFPGVPFKELSVDSASTIMLAGPNVDAKTPS